MTTLGGMGSVLLASGLSTLAVKALLENQRAQPGIITTLIVIRELAALVLYLSFLLVGLVSGGAATLAITAVGSLVLFARAFDATEYWFQAKVESGKTAPIRIAVVVAMLALRLLLWLQGAELGVFVVVYLLEALLTTIGVVARYVFARESPRFGRPTRSEFHRLAGRSWPLFLSDLARQINLRGDIVLIQAMIGSVALGIYSAAARLSEIFYFLPVVVMNAVFPAILARRHNHGADAATYKEHINSWYARTFWTGVAIAFITYFAGPPLITWLFGERYAPAGAILQIHVMALPFIFMAAVLSKWSVAENLLKFELWRNLIGAAANIALNLALLPSMGIVAAAWASVISYSAASFIAPALFKRTRPAWVGMVQGILTPVTRARQFIRSRGGRGDCV